MQVAGSYPGQRIFWGLARLGLTVRETGLCDHVDRELAWFG